MLLVFVGMTADALLFKGIHPLLPFIKEEFNPTRAQMGFITSASIVGGGVTALIMGSFADAVGVRKLLSVLLIGLSVGILVFSQITSIVQGTIITFTLGAIAGGNFPSGARAVMSWIPPRARGVSMGFIETAVPTGGIIGASLLPILAVTFGWRSGAIVLSVLIISVCIIVIQYNTI